MRRYATANEDFFSVIDTEEKAYYLGLMGADGYVATNGDKIGIGLSGEEDRPLLQRLRGLLGTTYPISCEGPYAGWSRLPTFKLRVPSIRLRSDLIRHGIVPLKTKGYEFNRNLDPTLLRHYVRGYMDGDGSISLLKRGDVNVSIVSSLPFLQQLAEVVSKELGIKGSIHVRPGKQYGQFSLGGPFSCFLFLHWLYGGSTVSMDRKRRQYERCKELVTYKIDNPHSFYPRHKTPRVMAAVERCCVKLSIPYEVARYNGLKMPEVEQRRIVSMKTENQSVQMISQSTGWSPVTVKKVLQLCSRE